MMCKNCYRSIQENKCILNCSYACKIYGFYQRNKISIKEGWTKEEYDIILYNILYKKINVLNELVDKLNRSLDEIVDLLQHDLIIYGKPLQYETKCSYCGKSIIRHMCDYNKSNRYCDMECRNNYKKENTKRGKENHCYNSVILTCANCGKEIEVPQNELKRKNRFGELYKFCSQKCCWEYKGKYYNGDKSNFYKYANSKKCIENSRNVALNNIMNGVFPQTMTKPHIKVNELLNELKIEYINEKTYKYYSVDIYLPTYNLIIEIMGDYFHSNPNKYSSIKTLNKMQLKDVKRDKSKHTYFKIYHKLEILYLWEYDIIHRTELCKMLIAQYIINKGNLNNYNSFNYTINNNKIILNKDIVTPYFLLTKNP